MFRLLSTGVYHGAAKCPDRMVPLEPKVEYIQSFHVENRVRRHGIKRYDVIPNGNSISPQQLSIQVVRALRPAAILPNAAILKG